MKKSIALGALALTLASGAAFVARRTPAADAAPVPGPDAPRASAAQRVLADGRVVAYPGAEVQVGTDFAGTLKRVVVKEKDVVKKGDLLAELDASEERAALEQARARIAEADADLKLAEFELSRADQLLRTKVGTAQAADKAARDVAASKARRATAEAEVARLAAVVAKSRILSPITGAVLSRKSEPGETVSRGTPLFVVADLDRVRVEAEVDESDSGRIALGARATVRAEGDSERTFAGRVEEIPDAVTSRRLKPQDPGRPSDTRVLLVKIALDEKTPLKLGRRVEVEIGR
ncbi:MAG TPA: efflux RND transporter periplasmic adaptor subunit [Thermoanaerobaculia bacterium]|jgi:RND family efflux transporter MFP subunit|nr:efflux RND transporter periplasmic adaptor subunit [Thermoanaerobaculia bacterium]